MKTLAHNPFLRITHKSIACILAFCIINMPVWALEMGDTTITQSAGSAGLTGSGNTVSVDLISNHAVLDWTKMDIGAGKAIDTLAVGGAGSYLLNRVNGTEQAIFNGYLNALGKNIFIVSPNGVIVGPDASITASAFTAAGLNISNDDFTNGIYNFVPFAGGIVGDVENYATIENVTDQVNFLGKSVLNDDIISLPEGGVVVMAAGDSVLFGQPGEKILVKMTSVSDGVGSVTNAGTIETPGGEVVLAAGDIFYLATLEPLETNIDKAVKVHYGSGTVEQSGTIDVSATTGEGGVVSLTAGDTTTLEANSKTYANAGTDGDSGLVSVHSTGLTEVDPTADIQATGGYSPTPLQSDVDIAPGNNPDDISVAHIIQDNSVQIIGDTVRLDTSVDQINATASDFDKKGKIYIEAESLTIADTLPVNYDNVILGSFIEGQSVARVDIELATNSSDGMITVGALSDGALSDGIITGGSGDITLRNLFAGGGVDLTPVGSNDPIDIETAAGFNNDYPYNAGNLFMIAGEGGINAGNLLSYIVGGESQPYEPGRIRVLTDGTGDITTKTLFAEGGGVTEVSAIAGGNLTVNGAVNAFTHETSEDEKTIGFARICLISENGDVTVNTALADVDQVRESPDVWIDVQGKFRAVGEIKVKADGNITIDAPILINAQISKSPNSESNTNNLPYTVDATVEVDAGGTIAIEGISIEAKMSGATADIDTTDYNPVEIIEVDTISKSGEDIGIATAKLRINQGEPPCIDCPRPPGLILEIAAVDDYAIDHMNTIIDTLSGGNTSVLDNDTGDGSLTIVNYTDPVISGTSEKLGTLTFDSQTGEFSYDPEDGGFAGGTVEFEYTIMVIDQQSGTVLIDTATVTLEYTNTLPTFSGDLGNVHMNTQVTGIDLLDPQYAFDADGDPLYVIVNGQIASVSDFIEGNNITAAELEYQGNNSWTYTPTDGYVGGESFTVVVWDGQYEYTDGIKGDKVTGSGDLTVNMTNTLPSGVVTLEDASMNAVNEELAVASGNFTDGEDDDFAITNITPATDDQNLGFGGDLDYNGTKDPYAAGDTYDYSADTLLPGYTGEDNFNAQLWDGQYDYVKVEEGPTPAGYEFFSEGDGYTVYRAKVYGTGTINLDVTNELPGGDAWFGQVHMDSQDVSKDDLASAFGDGVVVESGTYTGSVIGSNLYGGTVEYDGTTWTYSTDTDLPGYIGDDNDQYGELGYVADDLFTVNLSGELGGQYDYWFSEEPAPNGYEYYEPADIFRKGIFGTGTLSVDITNELPTIDGTVTIEHMNENIQNQVFATDHLDGNPTNELDALSVSDISNPGFGDLILIDNGNGTYAYSYDPAEGFVGNDSFEITVYDGQRDYVFVDGEIQSNSLVPVQGTVKMKMTNVIPSAAGDLGEVTPGDSTPQNGVTSPVLVTDPLDAPQQDILDSLSIIPGIYTLPSGSTLEFTGSAWIYTPASGAPEQETFRIHVWDGQYDYTNIEVRTPVYGEGTVQVSVTSTPPVIPAAPLPLLEIPELKGCPAVMEAAALELAVNSDELQLLIANSMATNPNLQPCDACENLLEAAAALKGINEQTLAAMNGIFNTLAPIDAPFTPEVSASIQTAFANFREKDAQLAAMTDEEYQEYQQYAVTEEVIEAFVSYVAVLDNDLKLPVGDAMTLVMDKYFESIDTSGNPNIGAYIIEQIQASEAAGESIVASAE